MHKYRTDDDYPSPHQRSVPLTAAVNTRDHHIEVRTLVTDATLPVPGKPVYFRVIDPPDTAPYVVDAQEAHADDNDPVFPRGILIVLEPCGSSPPAGIACALSGTDGYARVILQTHENIGGENYRVEGSLDPTFTCGTTCQRSGLITTWKRIYVESHKMFRSGAFLTDDVPVGAVSFPVDDISRFPTPPFEVRLIHAPPAVGGSPNDFHDQDVEVLRVEDPRSFWARLFNRPGPGVLHLRTLDNPNDGDSVQGAGYDRPEIVRSRVRPYLADAVGLTGTANDYFVADPSLLAPLLEQAFVELVWLADSDGNVWTDQSYNRTMPFIPLMQRGEPSQDEWIARKWMENAMRIGEDRQSASNHQMLFFADRHNDSGFRGFARVSQRFNDAWVFIGRISNANRQRESLVHEMTHQWRVNPDYLITPPNSDPYPGGHCNRALGANQRMYRPQGQAGTWCTMTSDIYGLSETTDGIVGFHYSLFNGQRDSEFLRIRRRAEPVPQNDNPSLRDLQ